MNYIPNLTLKDSLQTPTESHNSKESDSFSNGGDYDDLEENGTLPTQAKFEGQPQQTDDQQDAKTDITHQVNDQSNLNGENLIKKHFASEDMQILQSNPSAPLTTDLVDKVKEFETQSDESGEESKSQLDQSSNQEKIRIVDKVAVSASMQRYTENTIKSDKIYIPQVALYPGALHFSTSREPAFSQTGMNQSAFSTSKLISQDLNQQQFTFKPQNQNVLVTQEEALNLSNQMRMRTMENMLSQGAVHAQQNIAFNQGRWSKTEHCRFLEALKLYGKNWKKVQQHVLSRTSTQARSHAQKFFVKLDRKSIDLQSFLDSLDFNNLNNMASELLEYEDDDEGNDHDNSLTGSKRGTPPVSVSGLEKKEVVQPSKFKPDLQKKEKKEDNQNYDPLSKESILKVINESKHQEQKSTVSNNNMISLVQAASFAEQAHNQKQQQNPSQQQTQANSTPHKSAFSQVSNPGSSQVPQLVKPTSGQTPIKPPQPQQIIQQQAPQPSAANYYGIPNGGFPQLNYPMQGFPNYHQQYPSIQYVNTPQGVVPIYAGQYGQMPLVYNPMEMEHMQNAFNQQTPVVYAALDPMSQQMQYYASPYQFMNEVNPQMDPLAAYSMMNGAAAAQQMAQFYPYQQQLQMGGLPQGLDLQSQLLAQQQMQIAAAAGQGFMGLNNEALKMFNNQSQQQQQLNQHQQGKDFEQEREGVKGVNQGMMNSNQMGLVLRGDIIQQDSKIQNIQPLQVPVEIKAVNPSQASVKEE